MPITDSASISCETCIVPICAAMAEAERPATKIPVISGANSRVTEIAMASTTRDSAPYARRE